MNKFADNRNRGAAMLELAIILPVLVLLVFGITELGRAMFQWNMLTKAVTSGARYMARANSDLVNESCGQGANWGGFESQAKNIIIYGQEQAVGEPLMPNMDAGTISINVESRANSGTASPCVIIVEAVVPFNWLIWVSSPDPDTATISLTARTEERYTGE